MRAFRFDQAGVGESDGPTGDDWICDAYRPEHVDGLPAAIATLDGWGYAQSMVIGLCSGAYIAWHAAIEDPRIVALLVVNPQHLHRIANVTRGALATAPMARVTQLAVSGRLVPALVSRAGQVWRGEVRRIEFSRFLGGLAWHSAVDAVWRIGHWLGMSPPAATFARQHLDRLIAGGCAVHFIYSAGDDGLEAFHQAFGTPGRLPAGATLAVVDSADHAFTTRHARECLISLMDCLVRP